MEITGHHWKNIRRLFDDTFNTSFHYAFATVKEDGSPHVTPVGSLILDDDRKGFYFEEYLSAMPRNLKHNARVCILAVHTSKWRFFISLFRGKFSSPPAVRLMGKVGEKREATPEELRKFRSRINKYRMFKGYNLLWSKLRHVREIEFDSFEPVRAGAMTQGLWES